MAGTMQPPRRPSKRPSPAEDSDEEDARERVRIKKERDVDVETSRHVSEPVETQETNMTSQAEEEESEEDMSEEEEDLMLEDMDVEDIRERWEVAQTRKNRYAGKIRDAGVIRSVTLTNFMCHRHLTADFGGKMNFLVGHNGSGKSAILTAISIAFGGKAASTGRGSSLRDLVMKGADKATISITLENQGTGAFEPETYNPYLVIERIINSTGATAYKFRSSKDGKVLADKRETLTRIVDRFGLHIDSPLTVLTQDQARSFLQSSDPKSLYRFFLQGTLLESLSDSYTAIGQQVKFFSNLMETEKNSIPELQQESDRLSRKAREIALVFSKRKDVDDLVAELAWSFVHDGEKDAREAEADVANKVQRLNAGKQKLEDNQAKFAECEAQIKELDKAIQAFNNNEAPIKTKRESQRKKVAGIQRITAEMQGDIKKCEQAIALGAAEVEDYEARIQKKENASQGKDPEVARLRDVIQKHQTLIANLKRTKPKWEQSITEAEEALAKAVAEEQTATDVRMEASKAASDMGVRIDNLKAQSGSRLNAFGRRIDLVMREIDRAHWTAGKPIGPLGMHVSLTDHRYKDAFHSVLGQTLCLFAVLNDRDRSTMKDILIRCQRQGYCPGFAVGRGKAPVSVLQHSGDKFNYASGDLSNINDTILSKLEIDNDDVKRILVDKHQIERTFIWPQISGPNSVTNRVRELYQEGVKNCTFITADMFNARGTNGQDASGPIQAYTGMPLLTKDVAQDIEDSRNEQSILIRKRDEFIQALSAASAETQRCRQALATAKRELEKVTNGLKASEKKESEFADQLSEIEQADTGADLAELRRGAEARKRGEEEQLAHLQFEMEANQKIEREAKHLLKEIEEELEALAPQRTATIEATTVLAQDRSQASNDVQHYKNRIPALEEALTTAQAKYEGKERQYQDFLSHATRMSKGVRIETQRGRVEINRLIKAAQAACHRIESETGGSANDIARQVMVAEEKLTLVKERVIEMEKLLVMFQKGLQARHSFWTLERRRAAIGCNSSFIGSMSKRDMDAGIKFDHGLGHMYIRVRETASQTQADSNGHTQVGPRQYKTPKTMSGGERSFTTVSLLLAMWGLSSSPMRCLDEWDVFLDTANRSVAAKMLLDGAKNCPETQFILITPQSMGGIDITGPGNKIIKLADPARNQRTLDFQTQAQTQTQA